MERRRVRQVLLSGMLGLSLAAVAVLGADALAGDDDADNPEMSLRFTADDDETGRVEGGGEQVPDTEFALLTGGLTALTEYRGRPMVVNLFSRTCLPCVEEMPELEKAHRQLDGRVTFVGLAVRDGLKDARALVQQTGVTYLTGQDPAGKIARQLANTVMPTTFLVDATGRVVMAHPGAITADELLELVDDHLLS